MIRSIKVRAWDYVWEKMFTSEQITSIDFENNCIEYKDWFKYDDEEWIMFYDTNYLTLAKLQEEVINTLNSYNKFIGKEQNDEINSHT